MTEVLREIPDASRLYLKAAGTLTKKPKDTPTLPTSSVRVERVSADAGHLAEYAAICGFEETTHLPITFPHVMAGALHLYLMTQKPFPFPLLGLVHIRNEIRQHQALTADGVFDLQVRIGEARSVRQGIEFDLLTEALRDGEALWSETSTILHRRPAPKSAVAPRPQPPASLAEYRSFSAPADIGRRYAKVGRDYNPIHLAPWTARLFGFKRHIAHGMWSAARCAAVLERELGRAPKELSVQFKQPLFLPGKVALKFVRGRDGIDFSLLSARSDKTHLTGVLR
ncbi:MaoC/PaaZ C-terminal domain-containing protein [Sinimarinibacterium thermocellulolyticum]|uniref:MaoC/PaaZ C-terminal domain-containing protein n=1 Tax=Sinimarinibacterium thermocellulolyticum TaxID=3170016 RepID=A0ABV2AAJ2_9GAMM